MPITVTTAATNTSLTTCETVALELGFSTPLSDNDRMVLDRHVKTATALIENYCKRKFAQQRISETLPGNGRRLLMLSRFPLITLHGITKEAVAVSSSDYTIWDSEASLIQHDTSWDFTNNDLDYAVDYTYGYTLPSDRLSVTSYTLPEDIQQACIDVVRSLHYAREADSSIVEETVPQVYSAKRGKTGQGGGVGGVMGISAQAAMLLEPYVDRRV